MKYTIENLQEGLKNLTGLDFEEAETAERNSGNLAMFMNTSAKFQARLAATALGVNVHELKSLPINEYNKLTSAVGGFLFSTSDETTASNKSELL